ncbi:competence type IV pilus major pilin ComGC [Ornithinibacillus californiensis]|uniref:competence type IV pilus major pilin ComGC n=1 Tax=Ornithinibacillus californiensis TaxID=161536 RepID=UPI000A00AD96|nr:type II secretion system protein [Ornithinibacillus californiensis]
MLKRMFKNQKGFTLVELLAVIVILGIILAIAVPAIGNVIGDSEDKAHEANLELIKNAARLAHVSGLEDSKTSINGLQYSVVALESAGYLEDVPTVPGDDTKVYGGYVDIKSNGDIDLSNITH